MFVFSVTSLWPSGSESISEEVSVWRVCCFLRFFFFLRVLWSGPRAWMQIDVKTKASVNPCGVGSVCFSVKDQCWLVWIRERWQGLHRICPSSGWQPCSLGSGERSIAHSWREIKKTWSVRRRDVGHGCAEEEAWTGTEHGQRFLTL